MTGIVHRVGKSNTEHTLFLGRIPVLIFPAIIYDYFIYITFKILFFIYS